MVRATKREQEVIDLFLCVYCSQLLDADEALFAALDAEKLFDESNEDDN
jgi:hypothetical protein